MPSVVAFTRQLGAQSGVQLNPIIDNTNDRFAGDNTDQVAALTGRFQRGRIDRSFKVDRSNLSVKLGPSSSTLVSRLNEAYVHTKEALDHGAFEVVVSRLVPAAAAISYMVVKNDVLPANCLVVASTLPSPYVFAVKHLECFNDGVTMKVHADLALDSGSVQIASKIVRFIIVDNASGQTLFDFTGSLDPAAKDEFGNSYYLPNVVSAQTSDLEVTVATSATVATTSPYYGVDGNSDDNFTSASLSYFSEGGTTYANSDYDSALARLRYTAENTFGYLMAGGTRTVALLSKLIALGVEINKLVKWDVPGDLSPSAAITFYNQLNIDTHYSQAFWAPMLSDDTLNGGKDYLGTSALNVGLCCARNAQTDANGIAPKHFAVAGSEWPVDRTGIQQKYTPTEQELNNLAKARINPVIFVRYTTGGKYVFYDSLTGAKTEGDRKLVIVADMSSSNDEQVTQFGQECLQLPMDVAIKRMSYFLQQKFEAEQAAGWIKPSDSLDGKAFAYTVKPNTARPKDRMDVQYALSYEGTVRAIYVQQTISK